MTTATMSLSVPPQPKAPFQLLEVNIISAQDLALVSRKMRTYAVAWVNAERKLSTRIDNQNKNNPSWNDKFVFRVNESFLRSDTSAVMIEIYAVKWFRDVRVGMRFVALQVRRPSGRPQGILNIGMALLDGSMRSMPLYTQLSASAVGFRDLMGDELHTPNHHPNFHNKQARLLRRSRSERHSNATDPDYPRKSGLSFPSSEFGEPPLITITTGSMWSESDVGPAPSTIAAGTTAHDLFSLPETGGDVIDEWDPEKKHKAEDLKSKLERWKTELPPVYDRGHHHLGSFKSKSTAGHRRRHTDNAGLLSCFGDVYGFECAISCGVKPKKRKDGMSDSDDSMTQSIL
ncbi:hypothetical protein IFM89_010521 [Coptis chinensis]|uniref:C2 domain-containing protein n=1 Tax=Coptis chinensis TaxID=261450 RepID=A0A835HSB1_9MAGN|nr:hypothetical protein IFM89_010521 [Coptis chinensis]